MLEILTPMNKIERVSRKIDASNFVAAPGIWAVVQADGSLDNVTTDQEDVLNKLVISSATLNPYESHDIEVGRITTSESFGIRVQVDGEGFTGTPVLGSLMVVSSADGTEGKLIDVDSAPTGTYEQVARCEEYNSTTGLLIFRTMSPVMISV